MYLIYMSLSIIIPCRDEEDNISLTIKNLNRTISKKIKIMRSLSSMILAKIIL